MDGKLERLTSGSTFVWTEAKATAEAELVMERLRHLQQFVSEDDLLENYIESTEKYFVETMQFVRSYPYRPQKRVSKKKPPPPQVASPAVTSYASILFAFSFFSLILFGSWEAAEAMEEKEDSSELDRIYREVEERQQQEQRDEEEILSSVSQAFRQWQEDQGLSLGRTAMETRLAVAVSTGDAKKVNRHNFRRNWLLFDGCFVGLSLLCARRRDSGAAQGQNRLWHRHPCALRNPGPL